MHREPWGKGQGMRLAMAQMRVEYGEPARNLARAAEMARQAAAAGAELVLLPECLDLGWANPASARLTERDNAEALAALLAAAVQAGIHLVAGLTRKEGGRLYNRAFLVSPQGRVLGSHSKISLVAGVEDALYTPGQRLEVFWTPLGRIAIPICADNLMPTVGLGEALGLMGAQLLLSPCSWAVPPEKLGQPYGQEWKEPYARLARRHGLTVIGVSNVGPVVGGAWDGWSAIGNSLAVGPDGQVKAELPNGVDAEALHILTL